MRNPVNIVAGFVFIGVSGAIFIVAKDYPTGTVAEGMGARLVPLLLASILAILSILLMAQGFLSEANGLEEEERPSRKGLIGQLFLVPAALVVLLALYLLILERIGFLITTPFFLLSVMIALGSRPGQAVAFGTVFTVATYVVFDLLLGVPLPEIPFLGS